MSEKVFSAYLEGVKILLSQLGRGHPMYMEVLSYQAQLIENIENARKEDTSDSRFRRNQIVEQLNRISAGSLGTNFNEICFSHTEPESSTNQVEKNRSGLSGSVAKPLDPPPIVVDENSVSGVQSYWQSISDKFIQSIEKELNMNNSEYFAQRPNRYTAEGKINYLAILYFGQQKEQLMLLSNQLRGLYDSANTGFLSTTLIHNIKAMLRDIAVQKKLTSKLIDGGLVADPNHRLGRTIQNVLNSVDHQIGEVETAIAQSNGGSGVANSIMNLHIQLRTLYRCLEDLNKDLQKHLNSG